MGLGSEWLLLKEYENLGPAAVFESLWSVWRPALRSQHLLWPEYENVHLSGPASLSHPSPGTLKYKGGAKFGEHIFLNKILNM